MNKLKIFVFLTCVLSGSYVSGQSFQSYGGALDSSNQKDVGDRDPVVGVKSSKDLDRSKVTLKQIKTLTLDVMTVDSFGDLDAIGTTSVGCAFTGKRVLAFEKKNYRSASSLLNGRGSYLSKLHSQIQLPPIRYTVRRRRNVCGST